MMNKGRYIVSHYILITCLSNLVGWKEHPHPDMCLIRRLLEFLKKSMLSLAVAALNLGMLWLPPTLVFKIKFIILFIKSRLEFETNGCFDVLLVEKIERSEMETFKEWLLSCLLSVPEVPGSGGPLLLLWVCRQGMAVLW